MIGFNVFSPIDDETFLQLTSTIDDRLTWPYAKD